MFYFRKYGYFFATAIFVVALILGWFQLHPTQKDTAFINKPVPHFYQDPSRNIYRINIKVFYVVPKDKMPYESWHDLIMPVIEDSVKFHNLQFRGLSELT